MSTPLGRAFAAIALARFGSDRGWRLIAVNLGLPAHCASTGARHWHAIDKAGIWPIYVQAIGRLFERLQADPPPIDYERRRITAQPTRVQSQARRIVTTCPEIHIGRRLVARSLWSAYTGADATFAPPPLTATSIEALQVPEGALIEAAVRLGKPSDEPLTWQPP